MTVATAERAPAFGRQDGTISRAPGVPWRLVGSRILVAPSDRDDFEALIGGAAAIWLALGSPARDEDLVRDIASAFGTDAAVVRTDVAAAVSALCRLGLAEREPGVRER